MNDIDRKIAEIEGWAYSIMFHAWERGRIMDATFERVKQYKPSTDWADGGPLIEKYKVSLNTIINNDENGEWLGSIQEQAMLNLHYRAKTPLEAAMLAIIASKEE